MNVHPARHLKNGLKIEMTDPTDVNLSFKTVFSVQRAPMMGTDEKIRAKRHKE